ncbi:MAG: pseudouridine synthase [Candidatus Cloacimonetes bacterium]|nr:rRNA pseudouridine synthase [Candidatus Cloacimonadota bacterium]MDY0337483.1 pseudouridine synthase [Candidatus Cloacimonadaceae bacterium]MCK9335429.1 rRNA pseudouridine synthase [Candidatus Cloacimonadota bacterium]MDD2544110.1 pseudouridine synthase [Candidatus Cloacimonadota bacterium]MDD2683736.1 pseudouridine synthase [Candidatus Cloacimonadota bacterium]
MKSSTTSSKPPSKTASKPGNYLRLNRFLADCGLGSRRKTEELISSGLISVNGEICRDLSCKIEVGKDEVSYAGKILNRKEEKLYLILNKPLGYVSSHADEYGRKTVYDLLPEHLAHLPYAGRLDKNSEGLLLFTNDGVLIKQLTHPSHKVEKSYRVVIDRKLSRSALKQLREGVVIDGGLTQSAGVFVKSESAQEMQLKIVIKEGRKRQIRQMIEAVGAKVVSLKRLQFGSLQLKDLPVGRWRPLSRSEINSLYYDAGMRESKDKRSKSDEARQAATTIEKDKK